MLPQELNIEDFTYNLPENRIAQHPVALRDNSKLLISKYDFSIDNFSNLSNYLPPNSLMIFNDTKVFHARMIFHKRMGAKIEIFLLEPISPTREVESSFQAKNNVLWKCLVGNFKKWKSEKLVALVKIDKVIVEFSAKYIFTEGNSQYIEFEWNNNNIAFGELVEHFGAIPLPPYMNRPNEASDNERYQTVYAKQEGSVAAPTAGLHFTKEVLNSTKNIGIIHDFVTLDVGAGTFKPVKVNRMLEHQMHNEKIYISFDTIKNILKNIATRNIIAVGTTTTRTLESIYWFAMKLKFDESAEFNIKQWEPYTYKDDELIGQKDALKMVEKYMISNNISVLQGITQLIIAPSYKFRFVNILITNFHQPKSTLLLLVAAFYGEKWIDAYNFALQNDFRFLSYGDSCLFFLNNQLK